MRLWSVHPKFLDTRGIVALWREGLLARHVLLGQTRGYRNHPQLNRFKAQDLPLVAIDSYLSRVFDEANKRKYIFSHDKIIYTPNVSMTVTNGQLRYEWDHLMNKLKFRDPELYDRFKLTSPEPHPCFKVIDGHVELWEKT